MTLSETQHHQSSVVKRNIVVGMQMFRVGCPCRPSVPPSGLGDDAGGPHPLGSPAQNNGRTTLTYRLQAVT
jgi:hypothetical protein